MPEDEVKFSLLGGRWKILALVVSFALVSSGVGFASAWWIKSPAQQAAEAAEPPATLLTAKVERKVLVSTIVLRGQVTPGRTLDVSPSGSLEGSAVITRLPFKNGQKIKSGSVIAEVSGRPIIALPGRIVAYRDIRFGASGPDVVQLQEALRSLGHPIGDEKGKTGAGTSEAIRRLYEKLGYSSVSTEEPVKCRSKKKCKSKTVKRHHLPVSEVVYIPNFPARIHSLKGKYGQRIQGTIMQLSVGSPVVRSALSPADRGLVKTGMPVEIYSESDDVKVKGRLATIGRLPAGGDTGVAEGSNGHPITVSASLPRSFAGQDVRITITAGRSDGPVLVVPASALYGTTEGTTEVIKITENDVRQRIEVTIGNSSNGFMEVKAEDGLLREGDVVVIGK